MSHGFSGAAIRGDFPALREVTFLNSASMGAVPAPALEAVAAQLRLLAAGPARRGWADFIGEFEEPIEAARAEARRLLGASEDEVGLISDTTSGLHQAIDAIPFAAGDNVLVGDLEYPQVALAVENAVRLDGVELRFVRHRGGRITIDDYRAAIDERTRALFVSSVGWVTGQRLDLAALSDLAAKRGFFLVVDAVQHLGAVDLDCSKLGIDFLMAGGYKWLNAPFGVGLFYVRRAAHDRGLRIRRLGLLGLETPSGGWGRFYDRADMEPLPRQDPSHTVRRFEAQGTPNRVGAAGLAASLAYRNALDGRAPMTHVLDLSRECMRALAARGARIFTPEADAERAGIVTFTLGGGPEQDRALRRFLEERGIVVSVRYCSGIGGVRVAVHFFNVAEDVARLLSAVDDFRRRS
ncbi:MAG: hypothetical protein QOD06_2210 [Candidatus Binatota bacterium]|jgi:selenocysteine lyase/cysteine desulfurase|nr:hypothetical protein [Candidatus Binatota bacterium]